MLTSDKNKTFVNVDENVTAVFFIFSYWSFELHPACWSARNRLIVRIEAVRKEEVKLRGVGFVKQVGFKPGMKERGSYG